MKKTTYPDGYQLGSVGKSKKQVNWFEVTLWLTLFSFCLGLLVGIIG